jgi:spermidine synthase
LEEGISCVWYFKKYAVEHYFGIRCRRRDSDRAFAWSVSEACITGVDIDTVIIDIAKKYFLTGDIAYINFTVADAMKFVRQHTSTYDCIIIDIFVGNEVPEFVKTTSFITLCKQRLSPNGAVCINYLQDRQYREKSDEFNQVLRSTFSKVCDFRIANNRFFFASIV